MNGIVVPEFFRSILDAVPFPLLVVDDDVRIVAFNQAASALLGDATELALTTRGGEAMHCIHATDAVGGCGASEACATCVIRASVGVSCRERRVVRRPQRMRLVGAGGASDVYLLVTTNWLPDTVPSLVVLILQDIGELVSTQGLVPICMHCGRVRDRSNDWTPMESYLKDRLDLELTHGLCPECMKKHYPEFFRRDQ
jgi:PAS domain-containing protein